MPSSWLSSGAGAAQGLEELLTRQRQDEIVRNNMAQHAGTLAETVRSNQANEALHQQQFAGQESDRALQRQSLDVQREAQRQKMLSDEQNQERERTIQGEKLRPLNTPVEYGKYQQVRSLGVLPMSSYKEASGDPLPEGDQGPPLPKINFTGFQPELAAQQKQADEVANRDRMRTDAETTHADAVARQKALDAETITQHGITNEIARGHLTLAQQIAADKKAKENEIKLGAKAKSDLSALEKAGTIAGPLLDQMRKEHPDIEDPNSPADARGNHINPKYNTLENRAGNWLAVQRYKMGFYDEKSSPMIQAEQLLKPIQSGPYMSGLRNQKMMELVLGHMGSPEHTTAEQYSRLKSLMQMTPALKQAIVNSERPMKVDASGNVIERGGGTETSGSGGTKVGRFTVVEEP